jgi:hypothetical protein
MDCTCSSAERRAFIWRTGVYCIVIQATGENCIVRRRTFEARVAFHGLIHMGGKTFGPDGIELFLDLLSKVA